MTDDRIRTLLSFAFIAVRGINLNPITGEIAVSLCKNKDIALKSNASKCQNHIPEEMGCFEAKF